MKSHHINSTAKQQYMFQFYIFLERRSTAEGMKTTDMSHLYIGALIAGTLTVVVIIAVIVCQLKRHDNTGRYKLFILRET